jgi:plastocyanin
VSTVLAAVVVVVILAVAVVGYVALSSSHSSSSTSSTSYSVFPFTFSLQHTAEAMVEPGGYTPIVVLSIDHSVQLDGEAVTLDSSAPPGINVTFSPSNPVLVPPNRGVNVTVIVTAGPTASVGNDTITVTGAAGSETQTASFTVSVVKYRVVIFNSAFDPRVLNVTAGSTVYWQNLDPPGSGLHSVVFTTLPVNSTGIQQYGVFSYTFTTPGSYFYYSSTDPDHAVNGTINVLPAP